MTKPIRLDERMTHEAAIRLWEEIVALKGEPIVLDGSEVRHLGGSALQVLLAAKKISSNDLRPLSVVSASQRLIRGVRTLGAEQELAGVFK